MKDILLYGAGKRGIKYARVLFEKGIEIAGFCDSYKTGNIVFKSREKEIEKPIFRLEDIDNANYTMIVAIADIIEAEKVRRKIIECGMKVITLEQCFSQREDMIEANRKYVAEYHLEKMDWYFDVAEGTGHMNVFWGDTSPFYHLFQQLDLTNVVELACGRGRHVQKYISKAQSIILVDILEKNIDYCKKRFSQKKIIQYYVNNGQDLSQIQSDSCTALFTYDSMVHFEMMDVFQYLKETKRILKRGGKALFHHSNNTENYKVSFLTGKHGRNYMSKQLFAYLTNRAGLRIMEQQEIDWSGEEKLDCITLVQKD